MKKVLSLLLGFVFLQTQSWAISGSPFGNATNQTSLVGTYSGVLIARSSQLSATAAQAAAAAAGPAQAFGQNALGVFVMGIPQSDFGKGGIVLFIEGTTYQGGLLGNANPRNGRLTALAQAVHLVSIQVQQGANGSLQFTFDSRVDGILKASIDTKKQNDLSGSATFTLQNVNLGNGNLMQAGNITFRVQGFQQSTTAITVDPKSVAGILNQGG